ncbi:methyltransferase domain-containing protein [Nocardia sp. NPDC127526]|uniref:methyltransferase domain-containing protein n=1 Tax=Nocardia sp. NPDC127526 TaxID=3345393 RepID=UPI003628F055
MCVHLVARCLRGLESVVAAEILRLELGTITEIGHREIHFRSVRPDPMITRLSTADDVFLSVSRGLDVGPAKSSIAALADLVSDLDAPALRESRRLSGGPDGFGRGIEVSASFLGRRNFNRYDVEDVIGSALRGRLGLEYQSRRNAHRPSRFCSAWRLALDGIRSHLMLRIADRPLHRRTYRQHTIPGSLHPPLASAMTHLADIRAGDQVLDPCCGAGTLLLEAAQRQPNAHYIGFDLSHTAIQACRSNTAHIASTRKADAGNLPTATASVDRILCNPPWGTQVSPRGLLTTGLKPLWSELRRVLKPEGSAVVLIPDTRELATAIHTGFTPTHIQQVRVSGKPSFTVRLTPQPRP